MAWNGAVKILDFGIARAVQELRTSQTDAGIVKGKMSYIAPEMLQGQPPDARSDLFSLGVVLHELLCGRRLFVGENDLETLKLVSEMPVPRPSSLANLEVRPASSTRVILRALARDPAKRYQSADEMGQDLERLVLRKRHAASSFAKQARALVPQTGVGGGGGACRRRSSSVSATPSTVIAEEPSRAWRPLPPLPPVPPATPAFVQALPGVLRGGRVSWLPSLLPHRHDAGPDGDCAPARAAPRRGCRPRRHRRALAPAPVAAACTTPAVLSTVQISIDSARRAAGCAGHPGRHAHRARAAARRDAPARSGCHAARPR